MPVIRAGDTIDHHAHGSTFSAYVAPSRGSSQLCAWRLTVPAGSEGVPHRPSREEVLLVLDGELRITLDGARADLAAGDVVLVPAGGELRVDGGAFAAAVWVTTTPGLEAVLADGARMAPPWAG
ncbi:MAG: cupin domain-containing protein [Streptosporangiaceae bacterium]|jgi:quercetin dioxygenase-like cupin family protein